MGTWKTPEKPAWDDILGRRRSNPVFASAPLLLDIRAQVDSTNKDNHTKQIPCVSGEML